MPNQLVAPVSGLHRVNLGNGWEAAGSARVLTWDPLKLLRPTTRDVGAVPLPQPAGSCVRMVLKSCEPSHLIYGVYTSARSTLGAVVLTSLSGTIGRGWGRGGAQAPGRGWRLVVRQ